MAMAQELADLRSQVQQQQTHISSLTDSITRINEQLSYTAGTSGAGVDPLVRLEFFRKETSAEFTAAHFDSQRVQGLIREMELLRPSVAELQARVASDHTTNLTTADVLNKGLYGSGARQAVHRGAGSPEKASVPTVRHGTGGNQNIRLHQEGF